MSTKNSSFLLFLITILCLFPPSSQSQKSLFSSRARTHFSLASNYGLNLSLSSTYEPQTPHGEWTQLQESIGISAMHMQLLHNSKIIIFDRTDFGASNLSLPQGKCRYNDKALPVDCTAHSIIYDVPTNSFRPLMVQTQTDVWCSSAAVSPDGVLIQTGGYHSGDHKIRTFSPCDDESCDWVELESNLSVTRWYATNQILPDGRVIIVGGRRQFSYEFFPKNANAFDSEVFFLDFLKETRDFIEENNLYPFVHLLPDGNLFLYANNRSIVFDYVNNGVVKVFPEIPGEKRSYPATGSSVMLPLNLAGVGEAPAVEVMVCGGAKGGAYIHAGTGVFIAASRTCGRLRVTDPFPNWVMERMPMARVMERMPMARVMSDMLLLPTGDVIILNGAGRGTAGWEAAVNPVLYPLLYKPGRVGPGQRFVCLNPSETPRLYHSSAILLPDGRILVGAIMLPDGRILVRILFILNNLSLEEFKPPYLDSSFDRLRPSILSIEGSGAGNIVSYGQLFSISCTLPFARTRGGGDGLMVTMVAPSFTTHSFAMNQRLLELEIVDVEVLSVLARRVIVFAPPTANVAPPGYYMLFVVNQGVPGQAVWIKMIH